MVHRDLTPRRRVKLGPRELGVSSSGKPPLFLTNYRGGGIGDFGFALGEHLASRLPNLRIEETSVSGEGCLQQSIGAATYPGQLIANLGLTAWGKSGLRNFTGLASIGLHRSLGQPTVALVHHAIEIFDPQETGYTLSRVVRSGAHAALRRIRHCDLVAFSPRVRDVLIGSYGAQSVWLVPLPGNPARIEPALPTGERPKVVNAGYWAPYKGIDLFLDVAEYLRHSGEFSLVGQPHRVLSGDPDFQQRVARWRERGRRLEVGTPGYLTTSELDAVLSGWTIGMLPYTSSSGASASFQLFTERAVPVVATELPEFRYLEESGAGVLIAPATVEGLSAAIRRLSTDRELWLSLAERQATFSRRFSWDSFVTSLLNRMGIQGSSQGT
jgi:glycosyltransferase involved in cell wall biosynthesis